MLMMVWLQSTTRFFTRNPFFDPGSNVAWQNSNFIKIGFILHDKKVFKMLVRKRAIIWQRSWNLDLNILQDLVSVSE